MFCIYNTSQFGLGTFQVLSGHVWLVATVLNWGRQIINTHSRQLQMVRNATEKTERVIDVLKVEDRVVWESLLEDGKMWSISTDLSPGRARERSGKWRRAHVSTDSPPQLLSMG